MSVLLSAVKNGRVHSDTRLAQWPQWLIYLIYMSASLHAIMATTLVQLLAPCSCGSGCSVPIDWGAHQAPLSPCTMLMFAEGGLECESPN